MGSSSSKDFEREPEQDLEETDQDYRRRVKEWKREKRQYEKEQERLEEEERDALEKKEAKYNGLIDSGRSHSEASDGAENEYKSWCPYYRKR